MQPLQGLTVVTLEHAIAAPFAQAILGELVLDATAIAALHAVGAI